jgi:beta-glucosidase/6-phospho-beta-glucosidase/beta-galactosidase
VNFVETIAIFISGILTFGVIDSLVETAPLGQAIVDVVFIGEIWPDDLDTIATPLDYLGVKYYTRKICHDPARSRGHRLINRRHPVNVMARGWEVFPEGLRYLLSWLDRDYNFPKLYITEIGRLMMT